MRLAAVAVTVLAGFLYMGSVAAPVQAAESIQLAQSLHLSKPLAVIRFTEPRISYQRALYQAVSRAVQAKPDVRFELVVLSPGNERLTTVNPGLAAIDAGADVRNALLRMGIPSDRINMRRQPAPALDYEEVQLFVR